MLRTHVPQSFWLGLWPPCSIGESCSRKAENTNWLLMWSDQWEDAHECRKKEKGKEDVRKLFDSGFIHIHGVLWRTDAFLNEVFWEKEKPRWSLPLVLCARAKPSSIRKKSIHTRGDTEDISLCNNPAVQCWSYGNQQNRSKIIFSTDSIWSWWISQFQDQKHPLSKLLASLVVQVQCNHRSYIRADIFSQKCTWNNTLNNIYIHGFHNNNHLQSKMLDSCALKKCNMMFNKFIWLNPEFNEWFKYSS